MVQLCITAVARRNVDVDQMWSFGDSQRHCDSNTNVYKPAECFSSTLLKYQDTHTLHVL